MTDQDVLGLLEETDALLTGHFELRSGLHSERFFQCANLLRFPRKAEILCKALVEKVKGAESVGKIDAVISPAVGGILVGHEVARALDVMSIFAEKVDDRLEMRRFQIVKGARYVVAEDVITRGGRVQETLDIIEAGGGEVAAIALEDIRLGGPERVKEQMLNLEHGAVCIVNAVSMQDMNVFTAGLLEARAVGRKYLHRTAASFIPVRAGIPPRPLLTLEELNLPQEGGGLFVIGSYVAKTTTQVSHLLAAEDVSAVEIDVQRLLTEPECAAEIRRVIATADAFLSNGDDVALYTSRRLITGDDAAQSLQIGQQVSAALVAIVRGISVRPRYLVAKGGITSSDVAVKGLGVKRAMVLGQILCGVPVWQTKEESRFPGLTYIVFPGNVGGPEAVANIQSSLRPSE
jgi:orotate phosphoribosyltransferase